MVVLQKKPFEVVHRCNLFLGDGPTRILKGAGLTSLEAE